MAGDLPYTAGDFPTPPAADAATTPAPRAPDVHIGQITVVSAAPSAPASPDPLASLADRRQGRSRHGVSW
ncbi:hypothetical protein [Streptomyces longisporoflavus]|uniref:Uncharacterized protein n=1 Tax=Streptomyces longisporoflavus TaxID=28044 RepID=A0ABW7QHF4_9ACTN